MNKHRLTLLGGVQGELRVSASVLHETVGALLEGARQATRFFVEGESIRKGPRPAWLDAACEIQITSLSPGSAVLALEAPTLEEADPARFGEGGQASLFDEHERKIAKQTSVDLFGSVLAAIVDGEADDVMADRALLDTCVRFARAARGPFEGVQLDGLANRSAPVVIKPEHVSKMEQLRDETPRAQAVRVTGMLDTISASRPDVVLTLPDGATTPVWQARRPVAQKLPQDEASGVSAFFGTWPGDESDEELLEALRAIG